jgi:two-component system sensor histidine kinase BaeS
MSILRKLSSISLKSKLVLSYLLVILGTVIVLSFAVSIATQNYYLKQNIDILAQEEIDLNTYLGPGYVSYGTWNLPFHLTNPSSLTIIADANGAIQYCSPNSSAPNNRPFANEQSNSGYSSMVQFTNQNCTDPNIQRLLQKTLQDKNLVANSTQLATSQGSTSSIYASAPIIVNNQVIGVSYIATPNTSGGAGVINQINWYITLAGLIVAAIAALCSYLFVRRFVRPLEALTVAAERMKQGSYTQRVTQLGSQDEIGRLALTFNEMAGKIETDVNELHRQDQIRREMIANIAHDLATPLTAIQGLSEALADDVIQGPVARQETAQRIGREVQRLRRLVADVRQMTLMEAGQIQLDLAPLDLQSLVDETVLVIEPECEAAGITIKNGIPADVPYVQADSDRLAQVLLNLLDNARRHTSTGGKIGIWATQDKDKKHICITVADTGVGIDPADLPHIFERFYRADRSRAAITGGSGLGLAIVKAIITAHGGRVWAESKLGQGTHIMFTLPLAKNSTDPRSPKMLQLSFPSHK